MKHCTHTSGHLVRLNSFSRHHAGAWHSRFAVVGLSTVALAVTLVGCGGGGSSGGAANAIAVISGVSTGATSEGASNFVTGSLTITDSDMGQASFKMPATLVGTYGAFTFNAATGAWTYLIDNSRAVTQALVTGQTVSDTLTVTSMDGSATKDIKVSITGSGNANGSIALITTVPAASYPSTDLYAAEKVAVFDLLNSERAMCGFGKRSQNVFLDKAAQAHANYITLNNFALEYTETPGLPGFTGASQGPRALAAGYNFSIAFTNLNAQFWGPYFTAPHAEPFNYSGQEQSATKNLKKMLGSVHGMTSLLGQTTELGIGIGASKLLDRDGYYKTLNIDSAVPAGTHSLGQQMPLDALATYPCEGVKDTFPYFDDENPTLFPGSDLSLTPYGQPIYLKSTHGTTLNLTSSSITLRGGMGVPVTVLTKDNDPRKWLLSNEIFVVPTKMLQDNSTYDVAVTGTSTGMITASNPTGAFSRKFTFSTGIGYAMTTR